MPDKQLPGNSSWVIPAVSNSNMRLHPPNVVLVAGTLLRIPSLVKLVKQAATVCRSMIVPGLVVYVDPMPLANSNKLCRFFTHQSKQSFVIS